MPVKRSVRAAGSVLCLNDIKCLQNIDYIYTW